MKISVNKLEKDKWNEISEKCHAACFNKFKPRERDRIDFTLVAIDDEKSMMIGYTAMREHDNETIYWQYGGMFPEYKKTIQGVRGYTMFILWCKERYKRIVTLIENKNTAMLKLAAAHGFIITGLVTFKGEVLLEHELEF